MTRGPALEIILIPDPPAPLPDPPDSLIAIQARDALLMLNWMADSRPTLNERDVVMVDELRQKSAAFNSLSLSSGLSSRRAISANIASYLAKTTGKLRIGDAPGGPVDVSLIEFAELRRGLEQFGGQIVEQLQAYVAVRSAEVRLAAALHATEVH
jgi:hypothetical protein